MREQETIISELQIDLEEVNAQTLEFEDVVEKLEIENKFLKEQKTELEQRLALEIEVNCQFEEEPDSQFNGGLQID